MLSILALTMAAGMIGRAADTERSRPLNGFELGAGLSRFQLKPDKAPSLDMNGGFASGRLGWGNAWSIEWKGWRHTGTDANDVSLRQWGWQIGPRYTWNLADRLDGFAQVMAGAHRLEAEQGLASAHRTSASGSLGLGLDVHVNSRWLLRAQLDEVFTRYACHGQQSLAASLGAAFRWDHPRPRVQTVATKPIESPRIPPAPAVEPLPSAPEPSPAPRVPQEAPAPVHAQAAKVTVFFGPGGTGLDEADQQAIVRLAESLKGTQDYRIRVTGHTSRIGTRNQRLSEQRALAVAAALERAGIPGSRIQSRGASFHEPLAPNAAAEDRARNRRVEINVNVE